MTLEGRTALVTGGGRGIGRAVAIALAEDGADVAVNYRQDEVAARETVERIEASGRRGAAYAGSVGSWDDCERMADELRRDLGEVDIFVHSAGIASRGKSVAETDQDEVERLWRVHAFGAFALSKLLVPTMRTRRRGDVVVVSSVAGAELPANSAPYNMAKAAMEALAFTLAKEERRHGIHVNVVAPGLVDTEMGRRLVRATMGVDDIRTLDDSFPFGRVCRPEDVAAVVRFLVSEQADYLTGLRIPVDAGASASSIGLG
jgi:3-oxoacyl-[acyl-carrier protein] reductase